ncbi:MAG: MmcQ/YjbR family DNA-binding protein [Lachnospiraceae bacterium]|nr:MmcQ/YjbR family DNA-binding protein [Lachnospiraceae bacterium]
MTLEEEAFLKTEINEEKLEAAGFKKEKDGYILERDFLSGAFRAVIKVGKDLKVAGNVIEKEFGEEYLPLRVVGARGEFVYKVRSAYTELLRELSKKVGKKTLFENAQANRINDAIREKYGDEPDFPWSDDEYGTAGVYRHKDTRKWYGLVMYIGEDKLKTLEEIAAEKAAAEKEKERKKKEREKREAAKKAGIKLPPVKKDKKKEEEKLKEDIKRIDVLNLKIDENEISTLVEEKGVYPAFHMNRKYWISVRLDDTISDERVMELIEKSFEITKAKSKSKMVN